MKKLWLLQVVGNALAFGALYRWLGLRDSKMSQLVMTAVFGLLILVPWLWLQDSTMAYCADRSRGLWGTFRKSLSTLAIFSAVIVGFAAMFWALGRLEGPLADAGQKTASWLTLHLRKPIKPQTWITIYISLLWAVRWIVLPVLMLPIASGVARGVRGFRASRVFWLQYLIALVIGYWIPALLMHWVPNLSGTAAQVASFVLRFGIAYLLMVTAWLAVAFFSARAGVRTIEGVSTVAAR
jgi:hypothetical protein